MTMDHIKNVNNAPRSYEFQRVFSKQSLQLSTLIAREWEFPDNVIQAIDEQITPANSANISALDPVLHVAALMSQLQVLIEEDRVEGDRTMFACRIGGRLTDNCKKCFGELQRYAS